MVPPLGLPFSIVETSCCDGLRPAPQPQHNQQKAVHKLIHALLSVVAGAVRKLVPTDLEGSLHFTPSSLLALRSRHLSAGADLERQLLSCWARAASVLQLSSPSTPQAAFFQKQRCRPTNQVQLAHSTAFTQRHADVAIRASEAEPPVVVQLQLVPVVPTGLPDASA